MDREMIWNNYMEVGTNAFQCGQYDIAERMLRAALKDAPRIKENHGPLATVLENLADTLVKTHRYAKAELLYKRAVCIHEKHGNKTDNQDICRIFYKISELHIIQNRYVLGKRWFGRALSRGKSSTQLPPQTHINYLLRIAWILNQKGRPDDAIKVYNETLPIRRSMTAARLSGLDFTPPAPAEAQRQVRQCDTFLKPPAPTTLPTV